MRNLHQLVKYRRMYFPMNIHCDEANLKAGSFIVKTTMEVGNVRPSSYHEAENMPKVSQHRQVYDEGFV